MIFLEANGYALNIEDSEVWAYLFVSVIAHELSVSEFTEIIRQKVEPLTSDRR